MKAPHRRSFARALGLALVAAGMLGQLALAHTGVFAGALAAAFLADGHGHALTLLRDAGHLDVVLHHGEDESGEPAGGAPGFGVHSGDHVVHAASADSAREGTRRTTPAPAAATLAPLAPVALALEPGRLSAQWRAGAGLRRAAALLRTVVLRV
jgi:hypothetical protein